MPDLMQPILVTGASGFVGGALAQRLAAQGVNVRALVRDPQRASFLVGLPNISLVQGDMLDTVALAKAMQGIGTVFHVAAALGGNLEAQRRTNRDGTRNVALSAAEAGVQRFVHVSSIAQYGYNQHGTVHEDTPYISSADPYCVTKHEAEEALREVAEATRLPFSIIRPGGIYGARSGLWTVRFFLHARRRPVWFLGDGQGLAPIIHIDDVLDLLLICATHPTALGEAFNAVNQVNTWREFLIGYAKLSGHEQYLGLPIGLARPVIQLIGALSPRRSGGRSLPEVFNVLASDIRYAMHKAQERLAWQPRITLEEGLARTIAYLRQKGLLPA